MLKKLRFALGILLGTLVLAFIGYVVYKIWQAKHSTVSFVGPTTPWYLSIQFYCAILAFIFVLLLGLEIVITILNKKKKELNNENH